MIFLFEIICFPNVTHPVHVYDILKNVFVWLFMSKPVPLLWLMIHSINIFAILIAYLYVYLITFIIIFNIPFNPIAIMISNRAHPRPYNLIVISIIIGVSYPLSISLQA